LTDINCTTLDVQTQDDQQGEEEDDTSIYFAFEKVKDRRKEQERRYPFSFLLTLLSLGKMAGERTITGIVDWIKEREPWLKKELNWPKRFPVVATCTQALEKCDAHKVEQVMMCVIRKARERQ
jgi:hypothetical protein